MKTLKFMFAAAAAIGLASGAQAVQNTAASTGFEKLAIGTAVKYGVVDNSTQNESYFYYDGANAEDNESTIVAFTDNETSVTRPTGVAKFTGADKTARANALQVSTGTSPLLRTFQAAGQDGPAAGQAFSETTYVDTLVQFTVTPSTDTVTPGSSDKLMVYLKETVKTNDDGTTTTSTDLVVKAAYCGAEGTISPREYKATNVKVEPNKWYRLTVAAVPNLTGNNTDYPGYVGFSVSINGVQCAFDSACYDEEDEVAFGIFGECALSEAINGGLYMLSLTAGSNSPATLQAVGFAGEGLVDDLVVTTTDPAATVVNFTLSLGDNVTAINYTIGDVSYSQIDRYVEDVQVGATIKVTSVTYASDYEFDSYGLLNLTAVEGNANAFTVGDADATLTVNAKKSEPKTVSPGAPVTFNSEADATAALETLTLTATSPDAAVITDANYANYFKKTVVNNGDGTYSVAAELDETKVDADATATELAGSFDAITDAGVSVTAKPGLYYSVLQGQTLGGMTEGARTMAGSDGKVMLKATKFTGTGFYKVMVNTTGNVD